ncbi:MAG: hypothetical protein WC618_05120, partial [Patescibacteria group bacterium]
MLCVVCCVFYGVVVVETITGSNADTIIGVVVAVGIISGVLVAATGGSIIGAVEVLIPGTEEVATGMVPGIVVGADAGTIVAGAPGFIVAPQAPSEVLITPPSIYIHFGAVVSLSYIVTPEAAPPPTVKAWVWTLWATIFPPS